MKARPFILWLAAGPAVAFLLIAWNITSSRPNATRLRLQGQLRAGAAAAAAPAKPVARSGTQPRPRIPKHIWTFWNGCPPKIILAFVRNWCITNPGYEITIMTSENYKSFIKGVDLETFNVKGMPQRVADVARLFVIEQHGGIWVDASMLFTESLDWVLELQQEKDVDFVGYYVKADTTLPSSPLIENWFFAAIPGSELVADWRIEFTRVNEFKSTKEYIKDLREKGVDFQLLGSGIPADIEYLSMHAAMLKVLQKNEKQYRYHVMDCYLGPYYYLVSEGWSSYRAVRGLVTHPDRRRPVIKLRGPDRDRIGHVWWRVLLQLTSVSAKDFFAAFGVDYEAQKLQLCHHTAEDRTCSVIAAGDGG